MFEKTCRVLDILHMRCGFDCDMRWSVDEGWVCHVNYIDQGPVFDYDVHLDHWVLRQPPEVIACYVVEECQDAIEYHLDPEPADIDSDLGYDPYMGCVTDEV